MYFHTTPVCFNALLLYNPENSSDNGRALAQHAATQTYTYTCQWCEQWLLANV